MLLSVFCCACLQAANKAKETAKANDDNIKNQAVPIGSVKTDRLKVLIVDTRGTAASTANLAGRPLGSDAHTVHMNTSFAYCCGRQALPYLTWLLLLLLLLLLLGFFSAQI